ncbi:NmrA-like family protein [Penicillium angulare]|uniref:NmrA-like family protein n=1 Tax=Penicillium angulare TaxID=116970 RepID=A0A9W9KPE4_9EURO|nr:NmrA-like family protein [Penicillium angulare]
MTDTVVIQKVVLAGKGRLGSVVLEELLKAGFDVKILTRSAASLKDVPEGVAVSEVDYSSIESLQQAIQGYDAVLSTVSGPALSLQKPLIDASIAAGIKHFIPAEYAVSTKTENGPKLRTLPPYVAVSEIYKYLEDRSDKLQWTVVAPGGFLEYSFDLPFIVDFKNRKMDMINGGEVETSSSSFRTTAKAIVGVFKYPERVVDRCVQVHDTIITQKKVLDIIMKYDPKPETWTVVQLDGAFRMEEGRERIMAGDYSMEAISFMMAGAYFSREYQNYFAENDNDWLGIEMAPKETLEELVKHKIIDGISDIASEQIVDHA